MREKLTRAGQSIWGSNSVSGDEGKDDPFDIVGSSSTDDKQDRRVSIEPIGIPEGRTVGETRLVTLSTMQ